MAINCKSNHFCSNAIQTAQIIFREVLYTAKARTTVAVGACYLGVVALVGDSVASKRYYLAGAAGFAGASWAGAWAAGAWAAGASAAGACSSA